MKKLVLIIFLTQIFSSCARLSSVSTSSIPKNRSKKVFSVADRFIFLGFNFNNDYVNNMANNLAQECPDGKVKGILTKHESIVYFPLFAHKERVTAEGYCVR